MKEPIPFIRPIETSSAVNSREESLPEDRRCSARCVPSKAPRRIDCLAEAWSHGGGLVHDLTAVEHCQFGIADRGFVRGGFAEWIRTGSRM
jgi:hypothetical protein